MKARGAFGKPPGHAVGAFGARRDPERIGVGRKQQVMERTAIEITGGTTEWTSRLTAAYAVGFPVWTVALWLPLFFLQAEPEEGDGEVWRGWVPARRRPRRADALVRSWPGGR